MMNIDFIKLSPAENTTVLVTDDIIPAQYSEIARKVISYSYLCAEQVGFIKKPEHKDSVIRLEMSGGEFCGNGILAAAALARYRGLTEEEAFKVESSGYDEQLCCTVHNTGENIYRSNSSMPLDYSSRVWQEGPGGVKGRLIELPGITHLLLDCSYSKNKLGDRRLQALVKKLAAEVKASAVGVIPFYKEGDLYQIRPCVHVPETGSLIFERSCGSGTLALGLYISELNKSGDILKVKQPGGIINVKTVVTTRGGEDFKVEKAFIETDVVITAEGRVMI